MAFDALTLAAVHDELAPRLTGARLQKLIFADELSLAVEAFAPNVGRTFVLLSGDLEHGRVQRLTSLPARGVEGDSPFSLLVRKHLRNARVRGVHQPRLERVFELDCEQHDPSGRLHRVVLIVEAMGRRSNLVLVDEDGEIMDAARRTPPRRNPRRPVLPHLPYVPPPPQQRLFPEEISPETLALQIEGARGQTTLAKHLAERIAGLSPLAGRELAFRAAGAADASLVGTDWNVVARATREFLAVIETHAWQPSLALEPDAERPIDYAPYELRHLTAAGASLVGFDSISEAMQAYYARLAEAGPVRRGDPLAAERKALLAPLDRAAHTLGRRIAALEQQLAAGQQQRDPLRGAGEAILAHQAELPLGSSELVVDGQHVELDPRMSAVENAQAYFARYRKAREAEQRVPGLLDEARNAAAHVGDLRTLVEVADQMDAIRALRREVADATGARAPSERRGKQSAVSRSSRPYRRVSLGDPWEVLVGTSAAGNAAVTFDLAQADDLWLHARGIPGAHVILRTNGATAPDEIVERAAQIAAWHSSARSAGQVEVDVASRRYVKKIPNAPAGLVRYSNERTIRVRAKPSGS
jgi:predicted ribosome quality control (RQC) complex YloA/Tae2 family protein